MCLCRMHMPTHPGQLCMHVHHVMIFKRIWALSHNIANLKKVHMLFKMILVKLFLVPVCMSLRYMSTCVHTDMHIIASA